MHTFHLPCGECTITLEDVVMQLGFLVDGDAITSTSGIADPAVLYYHFLGRSPVRVNLEWYVKNGLPYLYDGLLMLVPPTYRTTRSFTTPSLLAALEPEPDSTPSLSYTHSTDSLYHPEIGGWPQSKPTPSLSYTHSTDSSYHMKMRSYSFSPKMDGCNSYQQSILPMMFDMFNSSPPHYYTPYEKTFVTNDFSSFLNTPRGSPMDDDIVVSIRQTLIVGSIRNMKKGYCSDTLHGQPPQIIDFDGFNSNNLIYCNVPFI
ncbi:hypothetical protein PVK06_033892 [Gossypium arboreum]|uniref:Aminotransferase-like plant mobile domain-containing protein n=1 Tax=Gossypium arboreum TaxID=29729 RepID=A0ABR0NDN5_GOSAR|nr:hypothetical protein PVK06_033892 [Gossypium arboreum]